MSAINVTIFIINIIIIIFFDHEDCGRHIGNPRDQLEKGS